ncbi:MAG: Ig-like domain-containing protein, partial [Venatoribacter sp.]
MSWVPGVVGQAVPQYAGDEPTVELGDNNNVATLIQPQDPIILNFNKPLDIHSVSEDSLKIWRDSQPEEFTWYQDGTALVIKPKQPLQYGSSYRLDLSSQITDLSGNAVAEQTLAFTMPTYESSNAIPTVILSAYPGFPCATKNATFGQDNGRCLGGKEGDDLLPIPSMPANRMINLIFSQPVNAETAVLGTTFEVEQCESTTNCASPVPVTGELKVRGSSLTFIPTQPWQDAALYRYRIKTASADSDAACQAKTALCALSAGESRPVVTAFLQPNAITNNPELEVYFTGAKATESVQQILRNLPSTDIDANFKIEASEAGLLTGKNTVQLEAHTPEKLIEFVKVGCDEQDHCPDDQIIHVTGALGADILGYDSTQKAVKVAVYPTQIFTSSATLYIRYEYDEDYSSPPEARTDTIETNAQLMRIRYAKDAEGKRTQPAIGWIKEKDGKAFMEVTLELYLDAPQLQLELLGASQSHDLHSRALELTLSGPVEFLADGRLQIQQQSTDKISIKVITTQTNGTTTATAAKMTLDIPEGGINMNYVTEPVKQ